MESILKNEIDFFIRELVSSINVEPIVQEGIQTLGIDAEKIFLVAVGKASWTMANAASKYLDDAIIGGLVITKYGHNEGVINKLQVFEAGHPIPDEASFEATRLILDTCTNLSDEIEILFLLSGGASSLFELPTIESDLFFDIYKELVRSSASIKEINIIRKKISQVKGGRFAKACEPKKISAIVLSDVLSDEIAVVGSGPTSSDDSTLSEAIQIATKYNLEQGLSALLKISDDDSFEVTNVRSFLGGNVSILCKNARDICTKMGYESYLITDRLDCEAREAGKFLAAIAQTYQDTTKDLAFIVGGETVVDVIGDGLGGRNQELVFSAIERIQGLQNVAILSFGSDGTDGPTDAAGAYITGGTFDKLRELNINYEHVLRTNNTYPALKSLETLICTGPTGTNLNDVSVLLIKAVKQ